MTQGMSEIHEEILEAIWTAHEKKKNTIEEIRAECADTFDNSELDKLREMELIHGQGTVVHLTDKGRLLAQAVIRRHRLAEVMLTSILKFKSAEMERVACQVEHSLHPEVEEAICTLLGHPGICPDGKPIPRGRCCRRGVTTVENSVKGLNELKPGERGKVTFIKPGSHSNLHQLISFGLNPGVVVTVHRKKPAFCIKFENTELALDEEIVKNIFVWRLSDQ